MQTTPLRVHPKGAFYRIQDPQSGLYARIVEEAPASPQPAEDTAGAVTGRHSHVRFTLWQTATWFRTRAQAEEAFARFIGVAPLEIVRSEA